MSVYTKLLTVSLIINLNDSINIDNLLSDVGKNLHNLPRFQSFDLQYHMKELCKDNSKEYGFINNSVNLYKNATNFNFKNIICQNIIMYIQVSGQYNPYFIGEYFKDILSKMTDHIITITRANFN